MIDTCGAVRHDLATPRRDAGQWDIRHRCDMTAATHLAHSCVCGETWMVTEVPDRLRPARGSERTGAYSKLPTLAELRQQGGRP